MSIISSLLHRSTQRRTYRDLAQLDDHLLRDIGFTRAGLRAQLADRQIANLTGLHARA